MAISFSLWKLRAYPQTSVSQSFGGQIWFNCPTLPQLLVYSHLIPSFMAFDKVTLHVLQDNNQSYPKDGETLCLKLTSVVLPFQR